MATKVKYDLRQQVINKNSTRAIGEQMNILTEVLMVLHHSFKVICHKYLNQ
ncbi:hypothetical protein BN1318_970010 [Staphylococcus capitis]|nr:hypothetical protein BN1318_970010 [Staphylococcus capitis]